MNRMTLEPGISNQLSAARDVVELCDPTGKILGSFVPAMDLSEWEPVTDDVTEEELDRREKSTERRYTTKEVLDHLHNLDCK